MIEKFFNQGFLSAKQPSRRLAFVSGAFVFVILFQSTVFAQIPQGFTTDNGDGRIGPNPASIAKIDRHSFSYRAYRGKAHDFTAPYYPSKSFVLSPTPASVGPEPDITWASGTTTFADVAYVKGFSWLSIGLGQQIKQEVNQSGSFDINASSDFMGETYTTTGKQTVGKQKHTYIETQAYLGLPLAYALLGVKVRQIEDRYEFNDQLALTDTVAGTWASHSVVTTTSQLDTAKYTIVDYGMIVPGLIPGLDLSYVHRPKIKGRMKFSDSGQNTVTDGVPQPASTAVQSEETLLGFAFEKAAFTSKGVAFAFGVENFGFQLASETGRYTGVPQDALGKPVLPGSLDGKKLKLKLGPLIDVETGQQIQKIGGYEFARKYSSFNFPISKRFSFALSSQELSMKDKNGKLMHKLPFFTGFVNMRFGDASPNSTGRCGVVPKTKHLSYYDKLRIKECEF